MEKFTFFFTKFKIKDFSVRTQLLPPPHSLPNMSGRFYAKNEADWTAGKKGPQPFHLIGQIMENKSVCTVMTQMRNEPLSFIKILLLLRTLSK